MKDGRLNLFSSSNGFLMSRKPNKVQFAINKRLSFSKMRIIKLAFFFSGLLGDIYSRILSRPWWHELLLTHFTIFRDFHLQIPGFSNIFTLFRPLHPKIAKNIKILKKLQGFLATFVQKMIILTPDFLEDF